MEQLEKYQQLVKIIQGHNESYYNQDAPTISDYEYDMLMQELKKMEQENPSFVQIDSPTKVVGGQAKRQGGITVKHNVPMLSLQDVFTREEVEQFVEEMQEKLENPVFVVEYKIDGLSMALRYNQGLLDVAVTRGDGTIQGEDVTANAKVIKDVKQKLKEPIEYIEVRGEVYMSNQSFDSVNKRQEIEGKKLFANPRNCAAGTLRQLDPAITKQRELSFFIFNIQEVRGMEFESHSQGYEWLKKQGLKIIENYQLCTTKQAVWNAIEKIGEARQELGYDIDGAVVKIDNFEQRNQLGATTKAPRWAVAYKYPPEKKETVLREIELSVGRTGRITPTAIFDTIRLCGTNVSRATLHNQDFIDELDIRIGDTIEVYKSGEIIPKINRVIKEKRNLNSIPYHIEMVCPVCNHEAIRQGDDADIKCSNPQCPSKLLRNLVHFVSRDAMDIKGFGLAYIEKLVEGKYIQDCSDIFTLYKQRDELIENKVIGLQKSTDNLLDAIEKSKNNNASQLLTSFGIPNVGKAAAKNIMKKFPSILSLFDASMAQLMEVSDIGETSAISICTYFHDKDNLQMIEKLQLAGVNMEQVSELQDTRFDGLTFVVTGTLEQMDRKQAASMIENFGGKVSGSVSKKTDYVLAGHSAGSKLTKAQTLGITVLDEQQFLEMIK